MGPTLFQCSRARLRGNGRRASNWWVFTRSILSPGLRNGSKLMFMFASTSALWTSLGFEEFQWVNTRFRLEISSTTSPLKPIQEILDLNQELSKRRKRNLIITRNNQFLVVFLSLYQVGKVHCTGEGKMTQIYKIIAFEQ